MCRYNPKVDLVFRKLFGSEENKDLLMSLINSIIDKEIKIKDLKIKNPYNLISYLNEKTSILDVKAVDENGTWYNIEMQVSKQLFYGKRALYYWSKVYSEQLEKHEPYYKLNKTIGIHLLDFNYFQDERYFRKITLKDDETNEIYKELDYEELYFIEMKKFQKDYSELTNLMERWISFLNKAYEIEKGKIPAEMSEPEIIKAVEQLGTIYFDNEERVIYEAEKKSMMDLESQIYTATVIGREEGMEKGREEGAKAEKIEIAKKLLDVLDMETISLKTGLTIEEIEKLKS